MSKDTIDSRGMRALRDPIAGRGDIWGKLLAAALWGERGPRAVNSAAGIEAREALHVADGVLTAACII